MNRAGANKISGANALPIRLVMFATVLALAIIAGLGWYTWTAGQALHEAQAGAFRQLELSGKIAYWNESVSAAARHAMSTGEAVWVDRYQDAVAQRRDAAVSQLRTLAPLLYASPPALELRSADEKLLEMDAQAFARAQRGDSAAAVILLNGAAYHREKQRSADASDSGSRNT